MVDGVVMQLLQVVLGVLVAMVSATLGLIVYMFKKVISTDRCVTKIRAGLIAAFPQLKDAIGE